MAHNLVSPPHIRDWRAVWELKKHELIPEDCIFVPGHIGDCLAGTTGIPESFYKACAIPSERVADEILDGHYLLSGSNSGKVSTAKLMRQRMLSQLGVACDVTPELTAGIYKQWVW